MARALEPLHRVEAPHCCLRADTIAVATWRHAGHGQTAARTLPEGRRCAQLVRTSRCAEKAATS